MYGGKKTGRRALWRAVVSVFNLEPGERLCPLCWESSRIHAGGGGGRRRSQVWGARVSCLCSRSSTGPSADAFLFFFFYTKMSLRIYGCDISSEREPLSHNPPPHHGSFLSAETCGVTVQREGKIMAALMICVL